MEKLNTIAFTEKALKIHKGKYDYSKVNYKNCKTKVCIICPEHGEFWQRPINHLNGYGCPICGKEKQKKATTSNIDEFVDKAIKRYGNKYDYSKVTYVNSYTKVCIICPKHGEFWQTPHEHLKGCGCKYCSNKRSTTSLFIEKSNEIHNRKYDYSKVNYKNNSTKVCIICPEHGEFFQTPNNHLNGSGCPKCAIIKNAKSRSITSENFIKRAIQLNGDSYDYSNTVYRGIYNKISVICPIHGEFTQKANDHINLKAGCPKCAHIISSPESEILSLLGNFTCIQRNRKILLNKEIDIYIPSLKLGIEYNGLRWHSEEFGKNKYYHINKLNECNEQGISLVQIFEDEWINKRDICESKLRQICGLNTNPKIFGRKCEVREIPNKNEAYDFLDKNHIQGRTGFTVALGAFYQGTLVGVMTFKREKDGFWDLNRFATNINHQCVGVGGKLFNYFTKHYDFKEVKSFADRRWTTNLTDNLYTKLGFKFDSFIEPTYWYVKNGKCIRHHKFGFRKQHIHKQYGLPLTMTEREMTTELGYMKIWDCGLIKYLYKNPHIYLK